MKKKPKPTRPWEENPGDYFILVGPIPTLCARPGNKEADRIIDEHDLNSPDRIVRRVEYLKEIQKFADLWTTETNPALKEIVADELLEFIDRKKELAFFGREFAKTLGVTMELNKKTFREKLCLYYKEFNNNEKLENIGLLKHIEEILDNEEEFEILFNEFKSINSYSDFLNCLLFSINHCIKNDIKSKHGSMHDFKREINNLIDIYSK